MKSPWLRLVLAVSIDGRLAFAAGGKSELGGIGDRTVLEESLAWSDGVLIGGKTLRAHRNTCLIHNSTVMQCRRLAGQTSQPIAIVVSNKQAFPINLPFFQQPIERWLITSLNNNSPTSIGFQRQFSLKAHWADTLIELSKAGLSRLVLLGGAQLVESLLEADQIDEMQLTITPRILGGMHTWVPPKTKNIPEQLTTSNSWHLNNTKNLGGNELMISYQRNRTNNVIDSSEKYI